MKKKKNKKKKSPSLKDDPAYQKLFADISKIVEKARAQGVDFGERCELLECAVCGAYENSSFEGRRFVSTIDDPEVKEDDRFIVLDEKTTSRRLKNGTRRFRTKLTFICIVCGAMGKQEFVEEFDEWGV
jgi:rubrerythrin